MISKNNPNIILIIMDCARADHLASYGYHRRTMPYLDGLAAGGVLYEKALSSATWSLPAHWSIFTGLYLARHGVWNRHLALSPQYQTIGEFLKGSGYETAAFSNNPHIGIKNGFGRGFDTFEELFRFREDRTLLNLAGRAANKALLKLFKLKLDGAYRTNRSIKKWLSNRSKSQPFFMFVNYMEPHEPYQPPWPYRTRFMDHHVKNASESKKTIYSVSQGGKTRSQGLSDRDIAVDIAFYDASLAFLDSQLQSLLNFMKQQGVLDNSLFIFTSDHGHSLGEHQAVGHAARWLYDTQVHVPLIMYGPDLLPPGLRIPQQVQLVDILPTVVSLVGEQAGGRAYPLQGLSLLPAELASASRPFSILEAHYWVEEVDDQAREMVAIRTDEYKYIWTPDGADELYNLKQDPAENHNLIDQEPAIASELQERLKKWRAQNGPLENTGQNYGAMEVKLDAEVEDRLRALGYIE